MASKTLLQAVAICAELTQTLFSEPAARALAAELECFPEDRVIPALQRCQREVRRGSLTLAAILERLDDGRPGPEEAFAMLPRDEQQSAVWTEEMAEAALAAAPLFEEGDAVAARMAFREAYVRCVQRAREQHRAARWSLTQGWDVRGRERAVVEAVARGFITTNQALGLLPHFSDEGRGAMGLPAPRDAAGIARLEAMGAR